jgi:hypothetical protein
MPDPPPDNIDPDLNESVALESPLSEEQRTPPFPQVLFPQAYVWYVFVSALDVMFTAIVLHHPHGVEVNPVANYVIQRWDLAGAVVFKFLLVVLVILICEVVGRRRYPTGRVLAMIAVIIGCVPVIAASVQLLLRGL